MVDRRFQAQTKTQLLEQGDDGGLEHLVVPPLPGPVRGFFSENEEVPDQADEGDFLNVGHDKLLLDFPEGEAVQSGRHYATILAGLALQERDE